MYDNELRAVTVDVDILEYYIGNVYNCRNTRYCDLEAYIELLMRSRGNHVCESIKRLADRWKWSRGKVRRFLDHLVDTGMIKIEKTPLRGHFYIYAFEPEESND